MSLEDRVVSTPVEIEFGAPDEHALGVWIEPWGDRVEIPAGACVRLFFDGDVCESAVVRWTDAGELIREYDTRDIPPVPEGFRPI